MKYGFGMLENTISTIVVDKNGLRVKLINSKWKCVSDIVTPGGSFPQGKELMYNLTDVVTYFDHPQQFQQLKNVQDYNNATVGSPTCTVTTRVSSINKLMAQSLFFY